MQSWLSNFILTSDEITKPSHTRLNFEGDRKQKTLLGGIVSILISLYVFDISIEQGIKMVNLDGPKINSQIQGLKDLDLRATPEEIPKVLFEVWATNPEGTGSDGSPMTSFELTKETEKYMKIRLQQVETTYPEGEETKIYKYFDINKCTEEFYAKSEMEKSFWDYNKKKHLYCLQDPDAYLLGTRDNTLIKKDTTYWIYQVIKCRNQFRARTLKSELCIPTEEDDCYDYSRNKDGTFVDPECASESDINTWLQDKQLITKLMNPQIDFVIGNEAYRENERWYPSIPLKAGSFTDTGMRFRQNLFKKADNWIPLIPSTLVKFFDLVEFNVDTMTSPVDNDFIGAMYYRLDIDQVVHSRAVFKFMDWLGAIAGIEEFLLTWLTFVFGGFLQYNAAIEIINQLYKQESKIHPKTTNESEDPGRKEHQIHLTSWERAKCYFSSKYRVYELICGSKKIKDGIKDVNAANVNLEKDFNTKNILDTLQNVVENSKANERYSEITTINKKNIDQIQQVQKVILANQDQIFSMQQNSKGNLHTLLPRVSDILDDDRLLQEPAGVDEQDIKLEDNEEPISQQYDWNTGIQSPNGQPLTVPNSERGLIQMQYLENQDNVTDR